MAELRARVEKYTKVDDKLGRDSHRDQSSRKKNGRNRQAQPHQAVKGKDMPSRSSFLVFNTIFKVPI